MAPDDDVFVAWYRQQHPAIARSIWVMCGDREVAHDVAAEAFSRALERWDRVSQMENPTGWVRRVAVNGMRRHARRAAMGRRLGGSDRPEPLKDNESDPDLWRAVLSLSRRQREAVALRYVADLSEAEVARAMSITEGAASATLSAARRRLERWSRVHDNAPAGPADPTRVGD